MDSATVSRIPRRAEPIDGAALHTGSAVRSGIWPDASVIVPVKNSQRTIRATVDALFAQDYPALVEVIVVGDVGDETWQALADVTDPRLVIIEHEETPGKREPAIKRDVGLQKARGQVLALADSDIIMDPDWLSRSVHLLVEQGVSMVCGGMRAAQPSFWSRFVDGNVVAAKTPRVTRSYLVTADNFGKRGHKPPITANAVMDRRVYDDCPMDDNWGFGYEDYEWFWRVASTGHRVFYAAGLTGSHHHRQNFRALAGEYRFSANGCVHFIRAFPESPLARKRRRQAVLLPLAAVAGVAGAATVIASGHGMISLAAAPVLAAGLVGREVVRARRLEGVGYAVAGVALGTLFVFNLSWRLARSCRATRAFYHGRHS
jgi:glycosyltransferase involved in cell wall biosynthesis